MCEKVEGDVGMGVNKLLAIIKTNKNIHKFQCFWVLESQCLYKHCIGAGVCSLNTQRDMVTMFAALVTLCKCICSAIQSEPFKASQILEA